MIYATMIPDGELNVETFGDGAQRNLRISDSKRPTEEFTFACLTPEQIFLLGQQIMSEGIRLSNEATKAIQETAAANAV